MKNLTKDSWKEILEECSETMILLARLDVELFEQCLQDAHLALEKVFNIQVPTVFEISFTEKNGQLAYKIIQKPTKLFLPQPTLPQPAPIFNIHIAWNKKHPWH